MAGESEFPERIQNKISEYIIVLNSRFPSGKSYYKISNGYADPTNALNDPTPKTIIYTIDDAEPIESGRIYIDQSKSNIFVGSSLYHHLFDSTGASLTKAIQISNKGFVLKIVTPK